MRLSVDHTTDVPSEVERIRNSGGNLEWGRVGGMLPMTRGIGNFKLEAEGFRCLPEVNTLPIRDVEFIVLASDGLWDVMTDEACCAFLRERGSIRSYTSADNLANLARTNGSVDDIAVVVAYFPEELPPMFDFAGPPE